MTVSGILRDGQIVGKLSKEEMNPNIIRKMMVGREIRGDYYREILIEPLVIRWL